MRRVYRVVQRKGKWYSEERFLFFFWYSIVYRDGSFSVPKSFETEGAARRVIRCFGMKPFREKRKGKIR